MAGTNGNSLDIISGHHLSFGTYENHLLAAHHIQMAFWSKRTGLSVFNCQIIIKMIFCNNNHIDGINGCLVASPIQ